MVYTSNTDHNINIIQPLKDNRGFNTVAQTQIAYFGIWAFVLWFVLLTVLVIILDQTQHKNDFLLARVKQRKDILFAKYTWLVVVPTLALLIAAGFQWFVRYWTIGADYLVIPDARYMLLSFLAAVITFVFLNIYVVTVDTFIGQVLAKPIVMIAGIFASGMLFTELNAYFEWQLTSDTHYWWPLLQVGMGIVLCLFSFWLNQRSSLEQINQVVRLPQLRVPFFWFVTTLAIIVFPGSQFLASKTHDTAIGSDALLLTSVYAAIVIGLSIVFILNKKPRRFWLKAE
jgi:TRAP-type C4-dicarboxylate transport system permease small subunit